MLALSDPTPDDRACPPGERLECSEIRLANNETIKVSGVAPIELNIKSQGTHFIDVYILPVTSHPLILGSDYLMELPESTRAATLKSLKNTFIYKN
jgi:hypothetical protein